MYIIVKKAWFHIRHITNSLRLSCVIGKITNNPGLNGILVRKSIKVKDLILCVINFPWKYCNNVHLLIIKASQW